MNKKLPLILILFCAFSSSIAQNAWNKTNFTEVVECPGQSKQAIFNTARQWFFTSYNQFEDLLIMEDQGQIIGRASIKYHGDKKSKGAISFTVKITVIEGKYQYEISNFVHKAGEYSFGLVTNLSNPPKLWKGVRENWCYRTWTDIGDHVRTFGKNASEDLKRELSDDMKKRI